jgi:hypothetical protein
MNICNINRNSSIDDVNNVMSKFFYLDKKEFSSKFTIHLGFWGFK